MQTRAIYIEDESAALRSVILGIAQSNGPIPTVEEAYDPKSLEHILAGTYPLEEAMQVEIQAFEEVLGKYQVEVLRPSLLQDTNQLFTRDIGFVIEDTFIVANILADREPEIQAIQWIIDQLNPQQVCRPPAEAHIEGGDVIVWKDYLFVGTYRGADYGQLITARTNQAGIAYLQQLFPHKQVVALDLIKSSSDAYANALHLDCCFQPIGRRQAIVYAQGFRDPKDYAFIEQVFGKDNLFQITAAEMYAMNSNIFSISPEVIVSERGFSRLNTWLREQGYIVEEIPYAEIAKQEGLLRCTTLPLLRSKTQ